MISYTGLPDIWSRRALEARYNPLKVSRTIWQVESWWWTQARRSWLDSLANIVNTKTWHAPEWEEIGLVAMNVVLRVGSWSARRFVEWRKAHRRATHPGTPELIKMAAPGEGVTVLQAFDWSGIEDIDWAMLEGETWGQFKARVFTPLRDQVYAVPTEFCDRYVATRLPPIVGATEELQGRVRDFLAYAQREAWDDQMLEGKLRAAGDWPLARVRNQIRTESATLYNCGRFYHFAADEAIIGYTYIVTLDDRTTEICRELHEQTVRAEDLRAVPPLHFSCRTLLEPIFDFERPVFADIDDLPEPGEGKWERFEGFGQKDLIAELRG